MSEHPTRLLLIDDDEESALIVRHLLGQVPWAVYEVDLVRDYNAALDAIKQETHDVYLIDYRLGPRDGLELLRTAREHGSQQPLILLTGMGDRDVDLQAMEAGATDYLNKNELTSSLLERTIRYAIEHQRLLNTRDHQARKLRYLLAELERVEERERRRIALLLHEEVQQLLVAGKMRLSGLQQKLSSADADAVVQVRDLLDEVLRTSRNLIPAVSPPILHSSGLTAAYEWLARWMRDQWGLHVELDLDPAAEPADEQVRLFLFHAIRELLFNVVKHAQTDKATLATTAVNNSQPMSRIVVTDAGVGFDLNAVREADQPHTHFGLFSIRERLEVLHGHIDIDSAPGKGTRITIQIPTGDAT